MSLVIAFTGREGAVMAGDMREILMQGPEGAISLFEEELYSGLIRTDSELMERAAVLRILLRFRDDKCKVFDREGILNGEVTESEGSRLRKRRLSVACNAFAIIDCIGSVPELKQSGEGIRFLVLGNEVTKRIAYQMIEMEWKCGNFADAINLVIRIMQAAASSTASVSRSFILLQTRRKSLPDVDVLLRREP